METVVQPDVVERYRLIAALPRPRPLRRSSIASFGAVLIITLLKLAAVALIAYVLWSLRTFASLPTFFSVDRGPLFGLGFVGLALLIITTGQRLQKKLVANGELALATVTGRYYLNPYWHVSYTFEDVNGNAITNEAMDKTGKPFLVAGQQMLVYYRADNPRKAIAQCESWYEPSVTGMEPDPRL